MNKNEIKKLVHKTSCGDLSSMDHLELILKENRKSMQEYTRKVIKFDTVKKLVDQYLTGKIKASSLIKWVNIVWFNDIFEYEESYSDLISDIFYLIEKMDEESVDTNSFINQFQEIIKSKVT